MRFRELKEAILLESFKDLKQVIAKRFIDKYESEELSPSEFFKKSDHSMRHVVNRLASTIKKAKQSDDSVPDPMKFVSVAGLVDHIRFIAKNKQLNDPTYKDTGFWIKLVKNDDTLAELYSQLDVAYGDLIKILNDPRKQEPDAETVVQRDKYSVYKLNNYAAARGICNKMNLNWCIGSSETEWFDDYGKDVGRDTLFVLLKDRTALSIHSGESTFLITDHTNEHDFNQFASGRGRGAAAITMQLARAGLDRQDRVQLMRDTIHDNLVDEAIASVEYLPAVLESVQATSTGLEATFSIGKKIVKLSSELTGFNWTATFNSMLNEQYDAEIDSTDYSALESKFKQAAESIGL